MHSDHGTDPHPSATPDELAQADAMLPLVYDELRRIAAGMLRSRAALTIQPTALVHEAFLRLSAEHSSRWTDEGHFRAIASMAMRRVMADHARSRRRLKRGAGHRGVTLGSDIAGSIEPGLTEVDDALRELEASSPRVARLVIYRYFGDLSVAQAAERLGISLSTAEADWRFARAWLKRRLGGSPA